MHNNIMRNVVAFNRNNILGYNRRVNTPFNCGNILGLNTAFTRNNESLTSTVARLGVGMGAQALANSLNNQPGNAQYSQPVAQPYNPPQNNFNNVTPSVGSPMSNVQPAYGANNSMATTNYNPPPVQQIAPQAPAPVIANKPTPMLMNRVSKGSKTNVCPAVNAPQIKVCLGWHTNCCDVDVSAFMLGADSKAIGEEWFVFYGQPQSPDGALRLNSTESQDMQSILINFARLTPDAKRIVFVLTINEAFQKRQDFSLISDAYIRIMDTARNVEIVSFQIMEYYSNISSMMVGELYLHNGNWKFNAVGNGVARDLAGLCEFYGIETT